ncbi:hypothetical protein [Desertibacillus haloalkaliphilus]|uniref:hypothetical protein n=1 Tax=Desertibacillus haloalkaliphilus TaxID=1328930 RepID=UPI001C252FDD|nr:hypothetical protein [Desertibacillus haloalkaliphilus]MBU8906899.1 hypothetical protein [Desertibacillus haloalkaliphilus]
MKKKLSLFYFLVIAVVLFGCGPEANIVVNEEKTRLFVDEDRNIMAFYVTVTNENYLPSDILFAKFNIIHEGLVQEINRETVYFTSDETNLQPFEIAGNDSYFFGESFEYHGAIPHEDLEDAVEVVIFNGADEVVSQFPISIAEPGHL